MGKKHTLEIVKQKFLENGCELLEDTYENNGVPMKYICCCGEESRINYNNFQRGQRCCGIGGKKKLTLEFVKQKFLEGGCELLETSYENAHILMRYICSCREESKISYANFKKGQRCCGVSGRKKHTYEFVYKKFLESGCELLEDTYENNRVPIKYICKCGQVSKITYGHFQQGKRCCGIGGTKKHTYEFVKQKFLEGGCELLETSYKDAHARMKYICSCGEESRIAYTNFQQGQRCSGCGGTKKLTYEFVYQKFLEDGCELLETSYKNDKTIMRYVCSCGEESKIRYNTFQKGQRCSSCKNKTERIVKNFLEKNNTVVPQAKFEWCKAKKHLPFDFLLEKFKIIIEIDGPQHFKQVSNWKSPEETLRIDKLKSSLALKNGYSVIRISQEDVFKNKLVWEKMLSDCIRHYDSPVCIFISKDPGLYSAHRQ